MFRAKTCLLKKYIIFTYGFLASVIFVSHVSSLKCYVCSAEKMRDEVAETFASVHSEPQIPTCKNFSQNKSLFIRECPLEFSKSCFTQIDGSEFALNCDTVNVMDSCVIANKVKYCYCLDDLCNGKDEFFVPGPISDYQNNDDEDNYPGGSGWYTSESSQVYTKPEEEKVYINTTDMIVTTIDKSTRINNANALIFKYNFVIISFVFVTILIKYSDKFILLMP